MEFNLHYGKEMLAFSAKENASFLEIQEPEFNVSE